MKKEKEAINRRRHEWMTVVAAGDLEGYLELLTEDAVWFPPAMPALVGKQAIRDWLRPFLSEYHYRLSIRDEKVRVAGDRAVERALFTSEMTPKQGGKPMQHSGTYIVLWRREPDGAWRIERYVDDSEWSDLSYDVSYEVADF